MDLATTFVGTLTYMSPERIAGEPYAAPSDIWSLGLTIMTCAFGRFPINVSGGYFGLLYSLRDEPLPELPEEFSDEFRDFIEKNVGPRPSETKYRTSTP